MAPDLNLLQTLSADLRVLIWTHNGPLDLKTPGIASVDYLLDGLVAGHVNAHAEEPLHHVVFSHPQFGNSFWVGFVNVAQVNVGTFLAGLQAVLPANAKTTGLIYGPNKLSAEWEKGLKGLFSEITYLN